MKTPSTRTGETTSIPPDILREIESFEEEAAKVLRGELAQDLFRPFRLQHGIYGQRQPGVQMVRIKIPFGGLNSTQCRVDRKSTRLNSSHLVISYAVFCLKKKKKIIT